ncbi:MAG: hypothetical protein Q8W45_05740 [Candidatus Palauibacterales bacterium]|nr:hypothetical protein [Candidatus Palauibacterales bacterium]MDP2482761.1 hypothetical protein [Candidatus Palauibacterales bacterium]
MRTVERLLRASVLALVAGCVLAGPAGAQDSGDAEWKAPHKDGHTFSPISGVPDAFVRSYINNEVGISHTSSTEIPVGIVGGDTLFASRGSLLFVNLKVEYQQEIKDWIAFHAQFGVFGRLGTGTSALLKTGVSATTGFELGWLLRLLETERGYLSASVFARNTNFTTINIADFVNDILAGQSSELVRKTPSMRVGGGLRYTHAFSPLIGLVSFAETGWGESVDRLSDDEWFLRFGATVDFDLAAVGWPPIGLAAGYLQDSFPEGGADITDVTRSFLFRVGFTGREDLGLGLNLNYTRFPTEQLDKTLNAIGASLDIKYYF